MATKDILKGSWKEMKGKMKEKWRQLTNDELTEAEGNEEKFLEFCRKNMGTPNKGQNRSTMTSFPPIGVGPFSPEVFRFATEELLKVGG